MTAGDTIGDLVSFTIAYRKERRAYDIVVSVIDKRHASEILGAIRLNFPCIKIRKHLFSKVGPFGPELLIEAVLNEDDGLLGLLNKMGSLVPA